MYPRIRLAFIFALAGACALAQSAAPAALAISGDVSAPQRITAEDLAKMPHQTVTVEEQDGTSVRYAGS